MRLSSSASDPTVTPGTPSEHAAGRRETTMTTKTSTRHVGSTAGDGADATTVRRTEVVARRSTLKGRGLSAEGA
jgi:hypothetical protein